MSENNGKKDPKVINFTEKFESLKDLQEYARAQFLTLLQANRRIDQLEKENKAFQAQIASITAVKSIEAELMPRSPEQELCEIEIRRLRDIALGRALSLEETKQLDLLIKNLYLAKGKPKGSGAKSSKIEDISESELIQLATLSSKAEGE